MPKINKKKNKRIKHNKRPERPNGSTENGIIYLDESGRGSLAGPMMSAAVCIVGATSLQTGNPEVNDSKKLSPIKRERLFNEINSDKGIVSYVDTISSTEIDNLGMGEAWKENMKRAILGILQKLDPGKTFDVIIDGKFARIGLENSRIKSYTGCVKADSIHYAASCAGILAKVTHDKIIENIVDNKLNKEEKQVFGPIFTKGKGYWYNQIHSDFLKSGIYTQFHRKSFNPLKKFIDQNKQKDHK